MMAAVMLMFGRTARQAVRNPGVAFGQPILISIVIAVIFGAIFGTVDELPGFPAPSYLDWIVPGTLFLSAVVGAGFTAAELLRDAQTGYLERVRLSPANPVALLAGRIGFEAVRGVIAATVVLAIGLAQGAENRSGAIGFVGLVVMTTGLAVAWNGIFFWSAIKTLNPAAVLGLQPLFFPVLLFSTWFGPLTFMPGWYEAIARVNPISAFLDGQRSILQGTIDWGHIWYASAFTVALAAITFTLAARAYRNLASRD
jgi:ABC-2 type transport system permease protein